MGFFKRNPFSTLSSCKVSYLISVSCSIQLLSWLQTGRYLNAAIHEWKAVSKMLSQMEIFYSRMKTYLVFAIEFLCRCVVIPHPIYKKILIVNCTVRNEGNFCTCDIHKTSAFTDFITLLFF